MKKYFLLCIVLFGLHNSYSQIRLVNKAEKQYDEKAYAYVNSGDLYDKLVEKEFGSSGIYAKLGDSYFFNGDYKNALKSYNQIAKLKDNYVFSNEQLFRYGQCLKSNGQFDEASQIIKQLNQKTGKELVYPNTDYLQEIKKFSDHYTIKPVSVNSNMPDYGVAFYKENKVLFASARDTNVVERMKDRWNKKPFFKLYEATITADGDLSDAKKLTGKINSVFHQSTPVLTKDGKQMYFTRSNFLNNKYATDDSRTNRLRIYRATLENDKWTNIEDLSINNDAFSNAHPALTPDGKTLVFASDRPGSLGQTDLYEVEIKSDGTFGEVKNMGSSINTMGRETFPFVAESGQMYFASDGHPGLGGLDVFAAMDNGNKTYNVVNLGAPLNSNSDDFGFVINTENKKGYFASNRGSSNDDQIYGLTELVPLKQYQLVIFGKVYDKKHMELLPKSKIMVYDTNKNKVEEYTTDNAGEYLFKVPAGNYTITYDKVGYYQQTHQLTVVNKNQDQSIEIDKYLDIDPSQQLITDGGKPITDGVDLNPILNLQPIYFDFDGAKIRPVSELELDKVLQVLKDYPNVSIDINSHTDSRGTATYNLKLSQKRANATVQYLLSKGVRANRIKGKGYGESKLLNNCKDGVQCTEEEHQLNRRSEFIVHLNNKK